MASARRRGERNECDDTTCSTLGMTLGLPLTEDIMGIVGKASSVPGGGGSDGIEGNALSPKRGGGGIEMS